MHANRLGLVWCFLAIAVPSFAAAATAFVVNPCGPAAPPPVPCPLVISAYPLGRPITVWVSAVGANGQRDYAYTGRAVFASSDPTATLPAPHDFVAGDEGAMQVLVTFNSLGTQAEPNGRYLQQFAATDTVNHFSGSADFFVEASRQGAPIDSAPAIGIPQCAILALLVAMAGLARRRRIRRV